MRNKQTARPRCILRFLPPGYLYVLLEQEAAPIGSRCEAGGRGAELLEGGSRPMQRREERGERGERRGEREERRREERGGRRREERGSEPPPPQEGTLFVF